MDDVVRSATAADTDGIRVIYEPFVLNTAVSFEIEPPDLSAMKRRVAEGHEWLVCERAGRLVGFAYAGRLRPRPAYEWSVEVSVYVSGDAQGGGVGRLLVTALLERVTSRGFVNAFAGIALPNPASVRLFESLGFEQIGIERSVGFKLGAWRDVGWWQLQLRPPSIPPPRL